MAVFQSFKLYEIPEKELKKALEHQLEHMSETGAGITRQFLEQGEDSLSEKQSFVFNKEVVPILTELCGVNNCQKRIYSGEDSCTICQVEYNL